MPTPTTPPPGRKAGTSSTTGSNGASSTTADNGDQSASPAGKGRTRGGRSSQNKSDDQNKSAGQDKSASQNKSDGQDGSERSTGENQPDGQPQSKGSSEGTKRRRRRRGRGGQGNSANSSDSANSNEGENRDDNSNRDGSNRNGSNRNGNGKSGAKNRGNNKGKNNRGGSRGGRPHQPVEQVIPGGPVELDEADLARRRGKSRNGRPVGRYQMVVSKQSDATHIAVLEGRTLIEYYVSRPSDDVFEIHGNIYLGRVENVLPGMEAAFVDIGTPKNAVLYRGDVQFDKDDYDTSAGPPRIEQLLKPRQGVLCQVTKNPIAHKGARLTTEVSLPGRFVVLVPESTTYGISKRLPDKERKRLRKILDRVKPDGHGIIVRTAAENITAEEIERDVHNLVDQWEQVSKLSKRSKSPALLYREPEMATRIIREEFNKDYRSVVIDDRALFDDVSEYVSMITPALADRVEFYDSSAESLPVFERYHVHEQLHKALDRKVWLPSGGSLIIEHTEALTVVDVNTGKNVGSSSLEETVFRNNLEAAEAVAHQLRLRDIGGIIVIDFVDMEDKSNRAEVLRTFRKALSRDKTRTQVFEISELGLAEMTRKRIGEGLLESLSSTCPHCEGRGHVLAPPIGGSKKRRGSTR